MVRINLIKPKALADQHLIAEYNEILMLLGYVRKYSSLETAKIPDCYCLGKGHILFFKNKLKYLKNRHEEIKKEMILRGFKPAKTIALSRFPKILCNDFIPLDKDKDIIKKRIIEKLKKKPEYYTYYRKHKPLSFLIGLIKNEQVYAKIS